MADAPQQESSASTEVLSEAATDERTARLVEFAACMDEQDHPSELTETIAALIREIHLLRPELSHSSDWELPAGDDASLLRAVREARWRGELAEAKRLALLL